MASASCLVCVSVPPPAPCGQTMVMVFSGFGERSSLFLEALGENHAEGKNEH
jgi:hypothetical protein